MWYYTLHCIYLSVDAKDTKASNKGDTVHNNTYESSFSTATKVCYVVDHAITFSDVQMSMIHNWCNKSVQWEHLHSNCYML